MGAGCGPFVCPDRVLSPRGGDKSVVSDQAARRLIAVGHAQFPPRTVAIGVDRRLRHAQSPGDLLGAQVTVDQPQAFPLPRGEQLDRIVDHSLRRAHKMNTLTTRERHSLDVMVALARFSV